MAKGKTNGAARGVSPEAPTREPVPPQGGTGVATPSQAGALPCRCGGALSRGTLPDGQAALARISMVPETLPQGLYNFGPVLDATVMICTSCRRIELYWSGR